MPDKNYGLLDEVRTLGAYIFGEQNKVPWIPYQEDGDWEPYLPKYEPQAERYETSGCTVWGAQNQLETLHKRLYGIEPNYSERFTYNLVPIDPKKGANPHDTYEAIRKHGLIDHDLLPVPRTLKEFTDPSKLTSALIEAGREWVELHDFRHEWMWNFRPENYVDMLRHALKTCPVGVSVTAWEQDRNGLYVSDRGGNNHWCLLYRIDPDGVMWVFDSYDHTKKPLHPQHNIRRAKRVWLNRKTVVAQTRHKSILERIVDFLRKKKA